jgi:hypothetical protein
MPDPAIRIRHERAVQILMDPRSSAREQDRAFADLTEAWRKTKTDPDLARVLRDAHGKTLDHYSRILKERQAE